MSSMNERIIEGINDTLELALGANLVRKARQKIGRDESTTDISMHERRIIEAAVNHRKPELLGQIYGHYSDHLSRDLHADESSHRDDSAIMEASRWFAAFLGAINSVPDDQRKNITPSSTGRYMEFLLRNTGMLYGIVTHEHAIKTIAWSGNTIPELNKKGLKSERIIRYNSELAKLNSEIAGRPVPEHWSGLKNHIPIWDAKTKSYILASDEQSAIEWLVNLCKDSEDSEIRQMYSERAHISRVPAIEREFVANVLEGVFGYSSADSREKVSLTSECLDAKNRYTHYMLQALTRHKDVQHLEDLAADLIILGELQERVQTAVDLFRPKAAFLYAILNAAASDDQIGKEEHNVMVEALRTYGGISRMKSLLYLQDKDEKTKEPYVHILGHHPALKEAYEESQSIDIPMDDF